MIDERLIYAKTAQGVAEVNTRAAGLSLAARRVLIMIDGKRAVTDLAPYARAGELSAIIEQLEAQGFVYPAHAGTQPPPPAATPALADGADDADDRVALNVDALKRRAVRELMERLGPDAEVIGMRIEQARTTEELRQRLQEAERLVSGLLGDAQAQDFLRALRRR